MQRLSNYRLALAQLRKFIDKDQLNELEQQGMIKAFEFTHELAWNVMKDYLHLSAGRAGHPARLPRSRQFPSRLGYRPLPGWYRPDRVAIV
ncbi:nucleotidyltransferase substrate binding protein [Duganella radicis]|uniref:nucleotidyltransferase substrate binding protein n=1 Tax=Duganella radicis TaxID=551988 RepID=UPI0035313A66